MNVTTESVSHETRHRAIPIWFAVALVLTTSGGSNAQPTSSALVALSQDGETISINGEIGPDTADRFRTLINAKTKVLEIQSSGGDALSAIAIGTVVQARKLRIIVDGACLSACAHFIFMAASDRTVLPNSLVLFHNTNTSMLAMLKPNVPAEAIQLFYEKSKKEKQFYASLNLPEELLYRPQIELHTSCYRYKRDPSGKIVDVEWAAQFRAWMPPRPFIEAMSAPIKGFWPGTVDELVPAFRQHFPHGSSIAAFGDPHRMSQATMDAGYAKIKECN